MAFGDNGNPVAFGTGQSGSDDRALFLKMFGGEVLTAFTAATLTGGMFREKVITSGKSYQFPRTGTSKAEYMSRGQEAMGNDFATGEVEVTIDGLLAAHHALWDMDQLMSHFDVRGPMTADMGAALARVFDQNNFRTAILAARTAAVGPFPGGKVVTNAALSKASPDGKAWLDALRAAKVDLVKKNIPANSAFKLVVGPEIFDAIKYATNSQGQYLALNTQIAGPSAGSMVAPTDRIQFEGITIFSSNLLPSANETSDTTVWAKYRANYSTTVGTMFTSDAVAVLKLKGMSVETTRDVRRQEDFIIATMATGHGPLRGECAVEFKTA